MRYFFITTYPETKFSIQSSLGISLLTNIQLVDYFLNSATDEAQEIKDLAKRLPEGVKEDLRILRTVFAHGVILRDFYIRNTDKIDHEWEAFFGWWETLNEDQVLDLIIFGIMEAMDYYDKNMRPIPAVEEILKDVCLDKEKLKDSTNRKQALKAVLKSWAVENIGEILPIYQDTREVKERVIRLLKGFWKFGFHDVWQNKRKFIAEWINNNRSLTHRAYATNEEAIYKMTGLYPDSKETDRINRAEYLTFVPVPNMGRLLSISEFEGRIYLMFEPPRKVESNGSFKIDGEDEYLVAFEGLGDTTRIQIIQLLATHKEMYAQQIVKELGLSQSTVSRHLNHLQQANLVTIRQDGNTKYYSINKTTIQNMVHVLESFL